MKLNVLHLESRLNPVVWADGVLVSVPDAPSESAVRVAEDTWRVPVEPGQHFGKVYGDLQDEYGAKAEPDYIVKVQQIPNDPEYGNLWGMDKISAPLAWDARTSGVTVAVIDSGVDYTHPDLNANLWRNPGETAGDGLDNDGNGHIDDVYGVDFANLDGDPYDDFGHGTHVAGTVGAVGNNGVGVTGVAWSARIMALKFIRADGGGSTSNAVRAIDYAIANGAKVINNSWGGGSLSLSLQSAFGRARDAGVVIVNSSGNNGWDLDAAGYDYYPAEYSRTYANAIAVGSVNGNDDRSGWSNYGSAVAVHAPGESILSTTVGGGYGWMSGTSMAAPHVAGAAALYMAQNPGASAAQVVQAITDSADTVNAGKRLNVAALLASVPPTLPDPLTVVQGSWVFPSGGAYPNGARLVFSSPVDAATFTASDITYTVVGSAVPVTLTKESDTQYLVSFAAYTGTVSEARHVLSVGPQISSVEGGSMEGVFTMDFTGPKLDAPGNKGKGGGKGRVK